MTDVSEFAKVLDHVGEYCQLTSEAGNQTDMRILAAIMAYDIFGNWSATIGPNAPFNESTPGCLETAANNAPGIVTVVSAVNTWIKSGMPADKASFPTSPSSRV